MDIPAEVPAPGRGQHPGRSGSGTSSKAAAAYLFFLRELCPLAVNELALWLAGTAISHGLLEIWITAAPRVDAARFCGTPRGRIGLSAVDIFGAGE